MFIFSRRCVTLWPNVQYSQGYLFYVVLVNLT